MGIRGSRWCAGALLYAWMGCVSEGTQRGAAVPEVERGGQRAVTFADTVSRSDALRTRVPKDGETTPSKGPVVGADGTRYTGQKITLELQDTPVHQVFRMLSELSGINMVLTPDVSGTVTMRLVDVPWDQVADIVARSANLYIDKQGNLWIIRTLR